MAIETYLIEDSEKMILEPEHLEEWTKTVLELGLEGQQQLQKSDKSPVPFLMMNTIMQRVYETHCPTKGCVKAYSNSTIPLRVLSLIALSEREKYFAKIEIWNDNVNPDPIAVGYLTDEYNSPKYLIARWGDELKDFASLKKEAIVRWREQKQIECKKRINEYARRLKEIDDLAEQYFNGEWVNI